VKALAGVVLVGLHAVAFAVVVPKFTSADLVLTIAPHLSIGTVPSGVLPADLEGRAKRDVVGPIGLRHARYSVTYRGGFTRSVGVSGLVGPFQDPAKPACTGQVSISQKLLDDGKSDSKTIANEIARTIASEMAGESIPVVGKFEDVKDVRLKWATLGDRAQERRRGSDRVRRVVAHRAIPVERRAARRHAHDPGGHRRWLLRDREARRHLELRLVRL
jgi:hypothetical protein